MKYLIQISFLLIFLLLHTFVFASNVDEIILATRNCERVEVGTTATQKYFIETRCKRDYVSCDSLLDLKVETRSDSILYKLMLGDCHLYGLQQQPALAYTYYLQALSLCERLDIPSAESEVLSKLIRYNLFSGKRLDETEKLIRRQTELAFDEQERLKNKFFKFRLKTEKSLLDSAIIRTSKQEWYSLLESVRGKYPKLQSDIESEFGLELESLGFLDESQRILLDAIKSAALVSEDYYNLTKYGSLANIGFQYLDNKNIVLALEYFKKASKVTQTMNSDKNSSFLNDWISQAFNQLGNQDSAYHYLKVSNEFKLKSQSTIQELKVKEILAKYNNGKLESDLVVEKQRGQLAFTWLGITIISILSLLLFYRNQLLKNKSTLQELETNKLQAVLEKQTALQNERTRIAAEMHDDLGGGLTTIKFLGQKMLRKITDVDHKTQLTKIVDNSQHLVSNMSEIIWAMNAGFDTLDSLVAYTRRYASEYLSHHELRLIFDYESLDRRIEISGEKRRHLFLVIKELLHNVVKHADATKVTLSLALAKDDLQVKVSDNGVGIENQLDGEAYLSSNGIQNMKNRITLLAGEINWLTEEGTTTVITVPLHTLDTPINIETNL